MSTPYITTTAFIHPAMHKTLRYTDSIHEPALHSSLSRIMYVTACVKAHMCGFSAPAIATRRRSTTQQLIHTIPMMNIRSICVYPLHGPQSNATYFVQVYISCANTYRFAALLW